MKKLNLLMCFILLSTFIFTGCTDDSREIDDQVYTLVIGVDKGVNNKARVTVQFPVYKSGGGDSGGGTPKKSSGGGAEGSKEDTGEVSGTIVETVEAPTLFEAINLLNTSTSRRISLVHVKEIVFSEKLAKEGIGRYLEPIVRFRETRRTMQVVICRGNTEDFIKENKTLVGESLSKAMELMLSESSNTGFFPNVTFHNFYSDTVNPYSMPYAVYAGLNDFSKLPELGGKEEAQLKTEYDVPPGEIPRKGDLKREFFGTAVFDGDKMVGSLTSYETRYFLMVKGDFKRGFITVPDKGNPDLGILLDARLGRKPQIKAYFENGKPVINVKINIECDLGGIQGRENYEKLDKVSDLNSYIGKRIQNNIIKTIEKTQKEWGTDIFGFGGYIARNFNTVSEFEKYNWLSHYRDAKVNVDVKVNVRRTGRVMSASPVRSTKGTIESSKER